MTILSSWTRQRKRVFSDTTAGRFLNLEIANLTVALTILVIQIVCVFHLWSLGIQTQTGVKCRDAINNNKI